MHETTCEWITWYLIYIYIYIYIYILCVIELRIIGLRICDDNMMLDGWFE
jgi:hypothetical protein